MTKKRRYSLTQEEAEPVTFAIRFTLTSIPKIAEENDPYAAWRIAQLENTLQKISTYQWEV